MPLSRYRDYMDEAEFTAFEPAKLVVRFSRLLPESLPLVATAPAECAYSDQHP